MIIISKLADYAVVLAARLVQAQMQMGMQMGAQMGAQMARDARLTTTQLAEASQLPPATVAKVLKALAKAGLVSSARGVSGGYVLARGADAITVAEVVAAVDGPLALTECAHDHASCEHVPHCTTRIHWGRINTAVSAALSAVTLADMAMPFGLLSTSPSAAASATIGVFAKDTHHDRAG